MKKGEGPPPDTDVIPDIPAPPYPGPPLDNNVIVTLPKPDGQQPVMQFVGPQGHVAQPVNPVFVVQQTPTDAPGQMHCPHCQNTVVTKTKYQMGMLTWIIFGVLFAVG
ncbi:hypothetical protein ILYODFUR_038298 [Ilyodon furcidens]|uniref:LITAF domain-containing protein n=1 Tax=Ilyodon furcidens TaxID=33524 RepID=A0ABV0UDS4_9TELE